VLDQQTTDVVARAVRSRQFVEPLVGDRRRNCQILQEGRDVALPNDVVRNWVIMGDPEDRGVSDAG
jgi:hypothetical protein